MNSNYSFRPKVEWFKTKTSFVDLCGLFGMFGSLFAVLRMLSGDGSLKLGGVVLGVCKTESALDQNTLFASVHYGLWLTIVVLLFSNY